MDLRPARASVDLDALAGNLAQLRGRAPGALTMAVVKADGYGHGMLPAARAFLDGGATWLGVAQLGEALALRTHGIDVPILAWLFTPGEDLQGPIAFGVDLGISAPWALDAVASAAVTAGRVARVHLKVDTGLGRGGVCVAQLPEVLEAARRHEVAGTIRVVGLFSHLACADDVHHPATAEQLTAFVAACDAAAASGLQIELRHLANSAGIVAHPATHFDLVRAGIAAYGYSPVPSTATAEDLGLTPAMALTARLAAVKDVPAGQGVSYGLTYRTSQATRLGLVPLGYGDGVPRNAGGVGPMSVGGLRYAIAGRVCMDQVVLDLGPDSRAAPGDEVVVFGPPGGGRPTVEDWAGATGTISYEIVTRLGPRVPRVYSGTSAVEGAS
jgi:alanine racemase